MKKTLVFFGTAFMALTIFSTGITSGSPCQDDHHGLRGKCRKRVDGDVITYACLTPIDGEITNCTYYVR